MVQFFQFVDDDDKGKEKVEEKLESKNLIEKKVVEVDNVTPIR